MRSPGACRAEKASVECPSVKRLAVMSVTGSFWKQMSGVGRSTAKTNLPPPPATKLTERWAHWAWQAPLAWITAHTILSQWLDKTDGFPWSPDFLLGSGSYSSHRAGRAINSDSDGAGRFLPVNPSIPLYFTGTNPATSKSKTPRRSSIVATCASTEQNHSSLAPENPTLYLNVHFLFFLLFVLESVFLATQAWNSELTYMPQVGLLRPHPTPPCLRLRSTRVIRVSPCQLGLFSLRLTILLVL